MQPRLSYTIWFTQRTGSTLLCKALESTTVAGNPNEWLNEGLLEPQDLDLYKKYGVRTPHELQHKLWDIGSTPNGVFGLKTSLYKPHHSAMLAVFQQFPGCPAGASGPVIWETAFPHSKHIFMTRRNKVRLAVSWWKAIQSEEWHRKTGEPPRTKEVHNAYVFEAIRHLLLETAMREAAIQEFFTEGGIVPLTIVYEDFIADYYGTVKTVLDFLGIPPPASVKITPPFYEKLADEVSEAWVQRFRQECQADWKTHCW